MKRANNEEINSYNFPNIQCGFITINVNDLVNKIRDFYINNNSYCNFANVKKPYTTDKIVSFDKSIIDSCKMSYDQFLRNYTANLETNFKTLITKSIDQTKLKNFEEMIKNAKEHELKIEQEFCTFFYELCELVKFEVEHELSIKNDQKMREVHILEHDKFVAEKLKLEATNPVNNPQQNTASSNTSYRFDFFAHHLSIINAEPEEVKMRLKLIKKIDNLNKDISDYTKDVVDLSFELDSYIGCVIFIELTSEISNNLSLEGIINPEETSLTGADENEACEA